MKSYSQATFVFILILLFNSIITFSDVRAESDGSRSFNTQEVNHIKGKEIITTSKGKHNTPIKYVKDEVFLKFHLGVSDQDKKGILKKHNLIEDSNDVLSKIGYIKARIPDGREVIDLSKEIKKENKIKFVEPNYVSNILSISDPLYSSQWYVQDTQFDKAWDITESTNITKVAVIDSGVNKNHPDLVGKILDGYNFINDNTDIFDGNGHGTFVAGIISANANDIGIKGLHNYTRIIPVKVIDENGIGTYEDAAKGIIYAADHGAQVINLSIGGYAYSFLLQDAIDYALAKGCIVIAAGGNDGIEQPIYPAAYPDVIGVSALGYDGQIWGGSNTGSHIDIAAPGVNIISTGMNGDYVYASGTSASAPMVSALAAMLLSEKPDLSSSTITSMIIRSAKDLGDQGVDKVYGAGEIDVIAAVQEKIKHFHDVAVRSVHIEPMVFAQGSPTYIIANIENDGTFKSEKCDVVLYEIVGEKKIEVGRKERVIITDKTKVVFEWTPEVLKDNVKFKVMAISEDDMNASNDQYESIFFSLRENERLYT